MITRALFLIAALSMIIGLGLYTGKSLITFQEKQMSTIEKALSQ